ncbi:MULTISPECIES: Hsp20/alpha crystallin family protein [unclassified Rickettsia]|uniref:Hsp20/alpha crystallin family protein n=1 Tax=unclassified Rickettsia TaxID=114295 RepID=UPI00082F0CF1|nr:MULTISPECIES: Hsp20/alpha crystallin family protein [unclassified Rickettsia]ODA36894.1 heat-shock protein [Rickettsia sp. wq]ODA37874.1 heat-shock protein [Rickettsia sp. wb]
MIFNTIKPYLLSCITVILFANSVIASDSTNKSDNKAQNVYLRHPPNLRPFSSLDYYWNSIFDDRLSIYDSSSLKTKFITKDKQYILVLEVPGYDKSQIKVKVSGNKLFVVGNIEKDNKSNTSDDYTKRNFNYVVSLYEDIDQSTISSNLKNGILTITLPRMEVKEKDTKEIPIQ